VKKPEDLAGKRIGIPEWAQTASVYCGGFMQHQYGIAHLDPLDSGWRSISRAGWRR